MTMPDERLRAVLYTRNFLRSLLDPKLTPKVPKEIRKQAYRCLRHYPGTYDMVRLVEDGAEGIFELDEQTSKEIEGVEG